MPTKIIHVRDLDLVEEIPEDSTITLDRGPDEDPVKMSSARFMALVSNGGNGMSHVQSITVVLGISDDGIPQGPELLYPAVDGVVILPSYAGHKRQLIARLASESDISSVIYSDAGGLNQIGAFSKYAGQVIPPGETEVYNVWVSNQSLSHSINTQVTVT